MSYVIRRHVDCSILALYQFIMRHTIEDVDHHQHLCDNLRPHNA